MSKFFTYNFERWLAHEGENPHTAMGEGFDFRDFKTGTTFYFTPKALVSLFATGRKIMTMEDLELLVCADDDPDCSYRAPFHRDDFRMTDKWKVVSKYERVPNMNPYSGKKYTMHISFMAQNIRNGRFIRLHPEWCDLLYVDNF